MKPEVCHNEETQLLGGVPLSTYWNYVRAGAGYFSVVSLMLCCVITQALFNAADYWLSIFTDSLKNRTNQASNETFIKIPTSLHEEIDYSTGMCVYSIILTCLAVFSFLRTIHFFMICTGSSITLHNKMLEAVVRAPISFLEQNTAGIKISIEKCHLLFINF